MDEHGKIAARVPHVSYLVRTIDAELDEMLPFLAAVALDGPKGVGKTETAGRRVAHTFSLDDPDQRKIVAADFGLQSIPEGGVLFDEWQHLPQVWDSVRRQVDAGAPPGRFLLTGSATPVDAAGTHSGAGRILSLRMRPMGLHERGVVQPTVSFSELLYGSEGGPDTGYAGPQAKIGGTSDFSIVDYAQAIASSGFPGIASLPARLQQVQLDSYLLRIIDRDLPDRDIEVRRPETLRRWLAAYAAASSTTATYSSILDATTGGDGYQPSKDTTLRYRDHLQQLWLLDPVPGWTSFHNPLKRVSQAPKHQLADPALALRLLNFTANDLLNGRGVHMFGPLLESLAALGVRILAQAAQARTFHLRTHGGDHEVDLIVEGQGGALLAIEVKLAAGIDDRDVRHLHWLKEQMRGDVSDLVILTTGSQAYRRADGVAVVPLALLGA